MWGKYINYSLELNNGCIYYQAVEVAQFTCDVLWN